jgi:hypothetical protein
LGRFGTQLLAFLLANFAAEMTESEGFDKPAVTPAFSRWSTWQLTTTGP